MEAMEGLDEEGGKPFRVLDVACGNMRFERFLLQEFSQLKWDFCAVDNCDDLVLGAIGGLAEDAVGAVTDAAGNTAGATDGVAVDEAEGISAATGVPIRYVHADVMGDLLAGSPLACASVAGNEKPFDIAVAFGFMHHIPGCENRCMFLRALLDWVRPGGYVAVSFWRFMSEEKLASKAVETTRRALDAAAAAELTGSAENLQLDENDYLLGWRDSQAVFRYCHHFSEEEINTLAADMVDVADVVARFHADGRTGDLNSYVVFRVR